MNHYVNEDTVTYDIYTNTISIIARDCVIEFLSKSALMEIVNRKYNNQVGKNVYIKIEALRCHISEINLPSMTLMTLTLNNSIINGPVNLYESQLIGKVKCSAVVFQEEVVFLASHFYQRAIFDYSIFEGEVDLTLAEGKYISFKYSRFNDMTYLDELFFEESVLFDHAVFKYDYCLFNCFIKEELSLEHAFMGMNCTIEGIVTSRIDLSNLKIMQKFEIRKIAVYKNTSLVQFEDEGFNYTYR